MWTVSKSPHVWEKLFLHDIKVVDYDSHRTSRKPAESKSWTRIQIDGSSETLPHMLQIILMLITISLNFFSFPIHIHVSRLMKFYFPRIVIYGRICSERKFIVELSRKDISTDSTKSSRISFQRGFRHNTGWCTWRLELLVKDISPRLQRKFYFNIWNEYVE